VVSVRDVRDGQWGKREFLVAREGTEEEEWVAEHMVEPALVRAFLLAREGTHGSRRPKTGNNHTSIPPVSQSNILQVCEVVYRHDERRRK